MSNNCINRDHDGCVSWPDRHVACACFQSQELHKREPTAAMVIRFRNIEYDGQIPVPTHCVDIWDHACLLFEHHDSQSALHLLSTLESQIPCSHLKTVLFMNIGIIFCHLGEYKEAKRMLTKAATSGYNYPMAFFLLGIADFELGLYGSANSAFKDAGSIMDNAGIAAINHECGGPDYAVTITLTSEEVKQNEVSSAYASTLVGKRGRIYPVLHRLPAGLLFKHPTATPIHQGWPIGTTVETNELANAGVKPGGPTAINRNEAEPYATSQTSSSSLSLDEHRPASMRRLLVKRSYSQSDGSERVRSHYTKQPEKPKRSFTLRLLRRGKSEGTTVTNSNDTNDSDMERGPQHPRISLDQKKSRSQHMLCREPMIKDTSQHELLSFLEETNPKVMNKAPRLQPRDAKAPHHDMNDIAQFAKCGVIKNTVIQTRHTQSSLENDGQDERARAPFQDTSIQDWCGGADHLQGTLPNNHGPKEKTHARFRNVSDRYPNLGHPDSPISLLQSTTSSNVIRRPSICPSSESVRSPGESLGHDMIDTPMASPVSRPDSSTLGKAAYWTLETERVKYREAPLAEEVSGSASSTNPASLRSRRH